MDLKRFTGIWLWFHLVVCVLTQDLKTGHCEPDTDSVPGSRLVWPTSAVGTDHRQHCPNDAIGSITRTCFENDRTSSGGLWGKANVKMCRNRKFVSWITSISLEPEVLDRGDIYLEQIRGIMFNLHDMISDAVNTDTLYPDDLLESVDILANISDHLARVDKENINGDENLTMTAEVYLNTASKLTCPTIHQIWLHFDDPIDIIKTALRIMEMVERFMKLVAGLINKIRGKVPLEVGPNPEDMAVTTEAPVTTTYVSHSEFVDVEVITVDLKQVEEDQIDVGNYHECARTTYPLNALKKSDGPYAKAKGQVFVYQAVFHSLEPLFAVFHIPNPRIPNEALLMNSDIVSSTVFGLEEGDLDNLTEPVVIKIKHQEQLKNSTAGCFFLNTSFRSSLDLWSDMGCEVAPASNETYTECHCFHLTNFAILTDVYGTMDEISPVHKVILSVISYVGGSLSMIGCTGTIVIFRMFKLKGEHIRCHVMLALSIILSQLVFFFGVELTNNQGVCTAVAIILHYVLTCMFCWMMVEGLHIYVSLVKVFEQGRYFKKYLLVGWGLPVIVVSCSAFMFWDDYGNENYCWLTGDALVAGFLPFIGFTIGCNYVILTMVVKVMVQTAKNPSRVKCSEKSYCLLRTSLRAAVILHPLLGLTWIFAFLSIDPEYTLVFTYLFTICNSLQGLMFFIFHCATNSEIKEAINGKWTDSVRTIRRVSSLWSVHTNFSDILDHKTGLPSCSTLSGGTLKVPTSCQPSGKCDGFPDDIVGRVSVDKLRRLSLAMADIKNEIRESSNSVDLDNIIKCAEMLTENTHCTRNIPDIVIEDEPPAYDECMATPTPDICASDGQIAEDFGETVDKTDDSAHTFLDENEIKLCLSTDMVDSSEA